MDFLEIIEDQFDDDQKMNLSQRNEFLIGCPCGGQWAPLGSHGNPGAILICLYETKIQQNTRGVILICLYET